MGRYARYADREWPDRRETDHRELGHAVPEDPSLRWVILAAIFFIIVIVI